jgi:hypothetical protein
MRKIGAILGITALAGVVFSPPPAAAFDIRVGPFYLHVPFLGHHYHHHHLHMRANPNEARNGPKTSLAVATAPPAGGRPSQIRLSAMRSPKPIPRRLNVAPA